MFKELKGMRKKGGKDLSKANYISGLQYKGLIKTYINDGGFVCYDTEELKQYQASVHRGRPYKKEAIKINVSEE